jgi:hypothetical protein
VLLYVSTRAFEAEINTHVYVTVGTLGAAGCIGATGLEATKNEFIHEFATTNTPEPLRWENTSGTWSTGWTTSDFYVNYGCGIGTNKPPTCMNGTYYGSNHWSDNKPT